MDRVDGCSGKERRVYARDSGLPVPCSIKEASRILNLSEKTMRRLCRDGEIDARKVGREWRIPRKEVLSLCGGDV